MAKMIDAKLTSKEIDFILYISRFQDDYGCISGVHYKEVCEAMNMSYQGFYDVKNSLIEKGFIISEKSNRIDHDITILGNEFLSEEDIKGGYVNTNHNIFYNKKFYEMKAGAKLLAMELMKRSYAGQGQVCIGTSVFYEKFTKLFHVTKRIMRDYLMSLKQVFSIGIKNGLYYMRPKAEVYRQPGQKHESDNYNEHIITTICRRNLIKNPDAKSVKDASVLLRQYKRIANERNQDIRQSVAVAIKNSVESITKGHQKNSSVRKLNPKLVHILLKKELGVA